MVYWIICKLMCGSPLLIGRLCWPKHSVIMSLTELGISVVYKLKARLRWRLYANLMCHLPPLIGSPAGHQHRACTANYSLPTNKWAASDWSASGLTLNCMSHWRPPVNIAIYCTTELKTLVMRLFNLAPTETLWIKVFRSRPTKWL